MTTDADLAALRAVGGVVWENQRYGAVYVVDAHGLRRQLHDGIPVVHLGQAEAVEAVRNAFPHVRRTVVALTCPREVAQRRITQRQTGDTAERLRAWDETGPLALADLTIDTSKVRADVAAELVSQNVQHSKAAEA
ncbi:kinase [Micromonospora peucetia]|uniref:kinase n=1 Tax=Micromonospora peucetia TaxID=47871 RepID=UPI00224EAB88|nr:kinase [Micromonospora peucetia]MCX4386947.1 kinase [Micromonospora peucetia]